MTEKMNLNMEDLEIVTGGGWTIDTITPEERKELLTLYAIIYYMNPLEDKAKYDEVEKQILEFEAALDAKYGAD